MKVMGKIFLNCFLFLGLLSILFPVDLSQNSDRLVITDSLNRKVTLPSRVERILSLQPEITRIIVALGGGEKLVGLDYFLHLYDPLFKIAFPKARTLPAVSARTAAVNIEMAMRLNPDVIFTHPEDFEIPDTLQSKMRKPVLALSSMGSFDKLLEEMILVGEAIGRSERARELIRCFNEKCDRIRSAVALLPKENRPRVYLSFWGLLNKTPIFYEPVNTAGGINLAEGLLPSALGTIGTVVKLEQILRWNPDIILIHGNFPPKERVVSVEGILKDTRLSSVKAVREKRVFYTFGFWNWWDPAQVLLETLYLARLFYPSKFQDLDIEKEGNEIFKKFYGIDNGFTELSEVLKCDEWLKN